MGFRFLFTQKILNKMGFKFEAKKWFENESDELSETNVQVIKLIDKTKHIR